MLWSNSSSDDDADIHEDAERFDVIFRTDPENFQPFMRDDTTLARPWVKPGTPNMEHRIGGLEKSYDSGHISYDPDNHHKMTMVRKEKIERVATDIPQQGVEQGGVSRIQCFLDVFLKNKFWFNVEPF